MTRKEFNLWVDTMVKGVDYKRFFTYRLDTTTVICYDKKTHKTYLTNIKSANDWLFAHGYKLWREMNDFILDSGVWEENPRPTYENTSDFRNIII